MTTDDCRIPLVLLSGFLGSGKTTLLRSLLSSPDMRNTAVLINEFGEISLDHLIVGAIQGETVVLRNGCVCCALREDLKQALVELLHRAASGAIPRFDRVIVEMTGLADPLPILQTLVADPMLRHQFRHDQTIVTVDAVFGAGQIRRHLEGVRQVVVADRLVMTKTDIATLPQVEATRACVRRINAGASLTMTGRDNFDLRSLVAADGKAETRFREASDWLSAFDGDNSHRHDHKRLHDDAHDHGHGSAVRSLSLRMTQSLDWSAFGVWLSALLHRHGENILRVKGILDVNDVDGPVVLQAVQHLVHPPFHLPAWPDSDRGSKLVFIVKDLDPPRIQKSLAIYLGAAAARSGSPPVEVIVPASALSLEMPESRH